MAIPPRPPFSALPLDKNGPAGNAWGLYGLEDGIGSLDLLTPSTVAKAAASEIKTGERVNLDWRLDRPQRGGRYVNDDIIEMNTQGGSQWDGFRHYAYQKAKRYYNNRTQEQLENSNVIGLDTVIENGGIIGRGVLLDCAAYCEKNSVKADTMGSTGIPLSQLYEIAEKNGQFREGDILFIRTGFTKAYNSLSTDQQKDLISHRNPGDYIGIESIKATVQWIWESSFATVASDSPAFEQGPTHGPHTAIGGNYKGETWEEEMQGGGLLHQWLLAGWGCSIREMFDLERLSAKCKELGRWNFFVTSVPLKIMGGVGSPPNAVAIF